MEAGELRAPVDRAAANTPERARERSVGAYELVGAIRQVLDGEAYVSEQLARQTGRAY